MNDKHLLIGVDGGATKVIAWAVNRNEQENSFALGEDHASCSYSELEGFRTDFKPVPIPTQIEEFQQNRAQPTEDELIQGKTYTEACAQVIIRLAKKLNRQQVLVGIGMPGLKTKDRRGIAVLANGPRMLNYAGEVETRLEQSGIHLFKPIAHIGSDADYCGMGEKFARNGSFKDSRNAYYLGGGTGAADALILNKELIPFDQTKKWLAKTWEMKNDLGRSLERYASASGIQYIYSLHSGTDAETLNREKIFPLDIANRAVTGENAAMKTMTELAHYLSLLLYERIVTLFSGFQDFFTFVNAQREPLERAHPFIGTIFDRIVIGQRLGDLLASRSGFEVLTKPIVTNLASSIGSSEHLSEKAKSFYLHGNLLKDSLLIFSPLREAPALGAAIDAYLNMK